MAMSRQVLNAHTGERLVAGEDASDTYDSTE